MGRRGRRVYRGDPDRVDRGGVGVLLRRPAPLRRRVGRGLVHSEARSDRDFRFAWWVVFAAVPIVVAGLLCQPLIKGPLGPLWVVAGPASRASCRRYLGNGLDDMAGPLECLAHA